jgi:hypothetical protein
MHKLDLRSPFFDPRAYSPSARPIHYWREEDQARAIDEGFFFERDKNTNRVRLIVIPMRGEFKDAPAAMAHIERRASQLSKWHQRALAFIAQQEAHRWASAWDNRVSRYTSHLRWYKARKAQERERAKITNSVRASQNGLAA